MTTITARFCLSGIAVELSALGYIALGCVEEKLLACTFGHNSRATAVRALEQRIEQSLAAMNRSNRSAVVAASERSADSSDDLVADELLARLVRYAAGEQVDFSEVPIFETDLTPFRRRVVAACRGIPWGETRTYSELAQSAGHPAAARAVGQVMAANRTPLVVPCHRVVPVGGGLGGFSAPQGVRMKRRLLSLECS